MLLLLISYCNFSSLMLSSIAMISFYILSTTFFLKCKELSAVRVMPITKKRLCSTHFIKIHKILKVKIWRMIKHSLLKFSFVWNFHRKIVCWIWSNIFWNTKIRLCNKIELKYYWIKFFITMHISNHFIKSNSCFLFFNWIAFFNIFINIIHIIWISNKSF